MENNKLKKLDKYFTKGLLTGVLATALIAGNVSCSQPAGGNTYTPNDTIIGGGEQGGTTTPPVDPTKPTEPTTPTTPTKPGDENEQKYPDYYIDEEFGGQRFVDTNEDWYSDSQRNDKFNDRYENAQKFLRDKVTELRTDLAMEPNGSGKNMIGYILDGYSVKRISNDIEANYTALAPFFKKWENIYEKRDDVDSFYRLQASYHKLAQRAYNNSLGAWSGNDEWPTNREMNKQSDPYGVAKPELVKEELEFINLDSFDALPVSTAKNNINTYLDDIMNEINISKGTLSKVVELALYNESLYGLNDLAYRCDVSGQDFKHPQRSLSAFMGIIDKSKSTYQLQSIDDGRTM